MTQDIINKLNAILKPYRGMDKIMEPYKRIEKLMEPIRKMHLSTELLTSFHEQIESSFFAVRKNIELLNNLHLKSPIFNSSLVEQLEKISRLSDRVKEIFENLPQALLLLAEFGWYLDYDCDLSLPVDLAELIKDERIDELDNYLVEYYNDKLDSIFEDLKERHSKRKEILSQIFSSFNEGLHYVTIPCVLSQIDGIANDFTKKKFFLKDPNNNFLPQVTAEITKISEFTMKSFLSPLTNQTPIIAHESILENFPISLNRHTILHGISVDYGDKKNSLKCISLLKYLSDILMDIGDE